LNLAIGLATRTRPIAIDPSGEKRRLYPLELWAKGPEREKDEMQTKNLIARMAAALAVVFTAALPIAANAQTWRTKELHKKEQHVRQQQHDQKVRRRETRDQFVHNRRVINRETNQQRTLRLNNERLRRQRNEAAARANRLRNQNHRPVIVNRRPIVIDRRPMVINRRPVVVYRPEVIYRTPPPVVYRYEYIDNSPRWYPGTPPNEWRSIANIAGGLPLLELLQQDDRLVFPGDLGALYSFTQFDRDRQSSVPAYRLRAAYFNRPFIYRNGRRYDRVEVIQRGHHYYRFARR